MSWFSGYLKINVCTGYGHSNKAIKKKSLKYAFTASVAANSVEQFIFKVHSIVQIVLLACRLTLLILALYRLPVASVTRNT